MRSLLRAWLALAVSVGAAAAAAGCHPRARYPPALFGGAVLRSATVRPLRSGARLFNPSVAPLPAAVARDVPGGAYVVSFRTRGSSCALLCGWAPPPAPRGDRAILCLYDGAMRELACLEGDYGSYDVFLMNLNGRLFATSVLYGHTRRRGVRRPFGRFLLQAVAISARNGTFATDWVRARAETDAPPFEF